MFISLECFIHFQNSVDDEFVISTARKCNKCTDKLVIFDARSMFAAGGNMLKVRLHFFSNFPFSSHFSEVFGFFFFFEVL